MIYRVLGLFIMCIVWSQRTSAASQGNPKILCPKTPCITDKVANANNKPGLPTLAYGAVLVRCGKTYYVLRYQNFTEATEMCCLLKASLLSIDTPEELFCLASQFQGSEFNEGLLWTSGVSDGSEQPVFGWCSSGKSMTREIRPDSSSRGRCVALHPRRRKLVRSECDVSINFICQVQETQCSRTEITKYSETTAPKIKTTTLTTSTTSTTTSTIPTTSTTESKSSIILGPTMKPEDVKTAIQQLCPKSACYPDMEGVTNIEEGRVPAQGGVLRVACGQLFYVGSRETFKDATRGCCALDMASLSLDSVASLNCTAQALQGAVSDLVWTSGASSAEDASVWCGSRQPLSPEVARGSLEPSTGSVSCLALRLIDGRLARVDCDSALNFVCQKEARPGYALQSSKAVSARVVVEKKSEVMCDSKLCPNSTCSQQDKERGQYERKKYFADQNAPIKVVCGKKYYLGSTQYTLGASAYSCCQDDMVLASMDSEAEMDCIRTLVDVDRHSGKRFWLGGVYTPEGWRWCSEPLGAPCREMTLPVVQSSTAARCLTFDFSAKKTGILKAAMCDTRWRYICEEIRLNTSVIVDPQKSKNSGTKVPEDRGSITTSKNKPELGTSVPRTKGTAAGGKSKPTKSLIPTDEDDDNNDDDD